MDKFEKTCDECGRPEDEFEFCDTRCMSLSCEKCTFLLQLYGTGCGNVHVYYLCLDCYNKLIKRGYVEP